MDEHSAVVYVGKKQKIKDLVNRIKRADHVTLIPLLLLLIALPITVLVAQQQQTVQQQAAAKTCENMSNPCGADTEVVVAPLCANQGEQITFKKKDGSFLDFENVYNFGNGVVQSSCVQVGNDVKCTARGTGTSANPISHHSVDKFPGEVLVCKYAVKRAAGGGGGSGTCTGTLKSDCNSSNKPILKAKWNAGTGNACNVFVRGPGGDTKINQGNECRITDEIEITDNIQNNTSYQIFVSDGNTSGSCYNAGKQTARTQCAGGGGVTPGVPTATPRPSPGGGGGGAGAKCEIRSLQQVCTTNNNPRISATWEVDGSGCSMTLAEKQTGNILASKTDCKQTSNPFSQTNGVERGKTYQLKVKSDKCSEQVEEITIEQNACSAGGGTPKQETCGTQAHSGSQGVDTREWDMKSTKGNVTIEFFPAIIPDRMQVYYESKQLWDSGKVNDGPDGNGVKKTVSFGPGSSKKLKITITADDEGTQWLYTVSCPTTGNAQIKESSCNLLNAATFNPFDPSTWAAITCIR